MTNNFSFVEFVLANPGKKINDLDYLSIVSRSSDSPSDFVLKFAQLFRPNLRVEKNYIFLAQTFEIERLNELIESKGSIKSAQTWLNLVEITGLFHMLTIEQAQEFADIVKICWNNQIKGRQGFGEARTFIDHDGQEVFVTIDCND